MVIESENDVTESHLLALILLLPFLGLFIFSAEFHSFFFRKEKKKFLMENNSKFFLKRKLFIRKEVTATVFIANLINNFYHCYRI